MAVNMFGFVMLLASLLLTPIAQADDPDILLDFAYMSPNKTPTADAKYFAYTGFRGLATAKPPPRFKVTTATLNEFPGLLGQSVSFALLQYPASSVDPLHTHPHGSELLYVLEGALHVGFVGTSNKLFTQILLKGDMFVFPKGLVHYHHNTDNKFGAVALSAFGSANPGYVSLPSSIFLSGVDDLTLARSFKIDLATVRKIKAGVARSV